MPIHQKVLLGLLSGKDSFGTKNDRQIFHDVVHSRVESLPVKDLAALYVDSAFTQAILIFLTEQHWILTKEKPILDIDFFEFVNSFAADELGSRPYLCEYLRAAGITDLKGFDLKSRVIESVCVALVKTMSSEFQRIFSEESLSLMAVLFEAETKLFAKKELAGLPMGFSLYRTFDSLDQVFNLSYEADIGMKTDLQNIERLYEGAGLGVQSGYSTILTGLLNLQAPPGARFVDLGSGYGRLGIVIGLSRPDIRFLGFEFVNHRVDVANEIAQKFSLQEHVKFITQDLSAIDFRIPDAEIYYLYDPFNETTYRYVLEQLIQVSRRQPIAIVTKGNARGWVMEVAKRENWPVPQEFFSGHLCLFRSSAVA